MRVLRMHLHLDADQDGVGRFPVKQANLKRMGLLMMDHDDKEVLVPYKIFSKSEVLQEIQKLGKDSDWSDHKPVLRVRASANRRSFLARLDRCLDGKFCQSCHGPTE